MKIRTALEGIGAALLLFPYYLPFFHPQNHDLFHHGLPVAHLIGGILLDLLGGAILVIGFLAFLPHLRPSARRIAEALFAGLMLWCMIAFALQLLLRLQSPVVFWERIWNRCSFAFPLLMGALCWFLPRAGRPVVRAVRLAIASMAFSALWIVPQLVHLALALPPSNGTFPRRSSVLTNAVSSRRVVWILFDELSYDQTFEHRFPGVALPNFDRLRAQSVSFSRLKPAGFATDRIIPSLLLGRRIEKFRSTIDGELSYWDDSEKRWLAYEPDRTLFGVAQRNGWQTGLDGWYNPYCQTLAPVLDACYRDAGIVFVPMEEYGASEERSALENATALPDQFLAALTNRQKTTAEQHIQAYRNIMARTSGLIGASQLQFVFLHLPVPHPPGIYDRKQHRLRPGGDYLDNLVLADETLGTLLDEIDASPSASQTTLIVSSDHSWRTSIWKPTESWTVEEERASGGKFDDRPVLLIRFPDRSPSEDIHAALPELLEHDVIARMLQGQMGNRGDLDRYLSEFNR
jgi:hypothetical protein